MPQLINHRQNTYVREADAVFQDFRRVLAEAVADGGMETAQRGNTRIGRFQYSNQATAVSFPARLDFELVVRNRILQHQRHTAAK